MSKIARILAAPARWADEHPVELWLIAFSWILVGALVLILLVE